VNPDGRVRSVMNGRATAEPTRCALVRERVIVRPVGVLLTQSARSLRVHRCVPMVENVFSTSLTKRRACVLADGLARRASFLQTKRVTLIAVPTESVSKKFLALKSACASQDGRVLCAIRTSVLTIAVEMVSVSDPTRAVACLDSSCRPTALFVSVI